MKAYVISTKHSLKLVSKISKDLKKNEVRIKIKYTNICGSDIKNFNAPKKLGIVLGHEASGIISECAQDIDNLNVGDRVCIFPMVACFKCNECLNDNHRDCKVKKSIGFDIDGTYSDEVVIDHRALMKLDDALDDIQGANIEPLACSNRLVKELISNNVSTDSNVLVLGDGPIAIGNGILLKLYGYKNISLIGKHQFRMNIAKKIFKNVYDYNDISIEEQNNCDVLIYSVNAQESLKKLLEINDNNLTICPQVRLPQSIESNLHKNIKFSRAFAYKYSDFSDIQNFMINEKIDNNVFITNIVDFNEIENFDDLVKDKNNNLKTTIKVN